MDPEGTAALTALCRLSCRAWTPSTYSTGRAFAAKLLLADGRVLTSLGGCQPWRRQQLCAGSAAGDGQNLLFRLCLCRSDRDVRGGFTVFGGDNDSSSVQAQLQGVDTIYSTRSAVPSPPSYCIADGRVVTCTWGELPAMEGTAAVLCRVWRI